MHETAQYMYSYAEKQKELEAKWTDLHVLSYEFFMLIRSLLQ